MISLSEEGAKFIILSFPFIRHSLVRAKGEVLVLGLLYVFCVFFVRSTISRQPVGRFTAKFERGRTLVPDVSSPLLEVSVPWGRKRGDEIFVNGSQWGIFAF